MYQRKRAVTVATEGGVIKMDNYPCDDCSMRDDCDGWDAQFCCELCQYLYEDDELPCDTCNKEDI